MAELESLLGRRVPAAVPGQLGMPRAGPEAPVTSVPSTVGVTSSCPPQPCYPEPRSEGLRFRALVHSPSAVDWVQWNLPGLLESSHCVPSTGSGAEMTEIRQPTQPQR